jgi:hypothetical protein
MIYLTHSSGSNPVDSLLRDRTSTPCSTPGHRRTGRHARADGDAQRERMRAYGMWLVGSAEAQRLISKVREDSAAARVRRDSSRPFNKS